MKHLFFSPLILIALVLSIVPLCSAQAFDPCEQKDRKAYTPIMQRYTKGLLFRIEKCGVEPSHLFGTVHSDSRKILAAVPEAQAVLVTSQAAGFEFVEPHNMQAITAKHLFLDMKRYPDGLPGIIGEKTYQQLEKLLIAHTGLTPEVIRRFVPWAAAVTLQYPKPVDDGVILDNRLQRLAVKKRIPIFGLETIQEQFALFEGLSAQAQLDMIHETLAEIDEVEALNQEMIRVYTDKDLITLGHIADENLKTVANAELRSMLKYQLIIKRNRIMANRYAARLEQGNQFAAVGALHLLGKSGVLPLLERKGYFVFIEDDSVDTSTGATTGDEATVLAKPSNR